MKCNEMIGRSGAAATALAVALLLGACCLTTPSALAAEGGCLNEARRVEQSSTYLANCRAYEQVTPVAKDSAEAQSGNGTPFESTRGVFAAVDGDRLGWVTEYPGLAGASSDSFGLDYLSSRGSEGWSTEDTVPPQSPVTGRYCPENLGIVGWSRNLTKGVLAEGAGQESGDSGNGEAFNNSFGCDHPEPALREADGAEIKEPEDFQNLFLRNNETGFYQLVNVTPSDAPTPTPGGHSYQQYSWSDYLAGSADLEHVAFEDELPLTEEAEKLSPEVEAACKETPKGRACWEDHDDLYVWSEGQQPAVRMVTILPDGKPVEGILAGSTRTYVGDGNADHPLNLADYRHALSANGSRIFFESKGDLYVRENAGQPQSALGQSGECTEPAKACTIQLDLPQGGKGTGGGGKWLGANEEGTKVFFTDEQDLTSTAVEGSGANLYEYELPSKADTSGALIDLTPDARAEVLGMSGVSEDGSYVYFVAKGKLAGNDTVAGRSAEQPGPDEGANNLYLGHEGAITFVASLSEKDECDWTSDTGCYPAEPGHSGESGSTARISGNGRYLAFNSVNKLTGYQNVGSLCGLVYENGFKGYGPGSCDEIFLYEANGNKLACVSCNSNGDPSGSGAAIDWPATVDRDGTILRNAYPQRNVSEVGQVFFTTSEPLLPRQDSNGVSDVYEYEGGALHLISSGTSAAPSYFLDASPSGNDVFFATAQKLLPRDTDSAYDIYDARVGGGFPEPSPSSALCESEGCKEPANPTGLFSAPPSTTFAGPGNIVQAKTPPKPKPKETAKQRREAELQRALTKCKQRYRRNRHERTTCKQRARRRYGATRRRAGRHGGGGK